MSTMPICWAVVAVPVLVVPPELPVPPEPPVLPDPELPEPLPEPLPGTPFELLPPVEPGTIYELELDLWATANVFRAGHAIPLEVSSSNFPRFDRNSNTGGTIWQESEADFVEAVNRVHHSAAHPSHLVLPIIDRGFDPIKELF